MGLGKTVITLTAFDQLKYDRFRVNKLLAIAPKRVAEGTWSREAAKWDHLQRLRISLALGSEKQRTRALNTPADVYIINRENVCWLVEYYRNAWPFDMVAIDESSSFKAHQAKRFKALTWVRPHIGRLVELTGTPAPNGLMDLWAPLYLLDQGERLGKHIGQKCPNGPISWQLLLMEKIPSVCGPMERYLWQAMMNLGNKTHSIGSFGNT